MKKEKISNKNGKTDSEEDVKLNKVNENGRWSVFFIFCRSFGAYFQFYKKNLNFYKFIKVKILNIRLIKCKKFEKKITKKLK